MLSGHVPDSWDTEHTRGAREATMKLELLTVTPGDDGEKRQQKNNLSAKAKRHRESQPDIRPHGAAPGPKGHRAYETRMRIHDSSTDTADAEVPAPLTVSLLHNVLLAGFGPILYFQKCPGQHAKVASHQIFRDFPGHGTLKEIP
ncbi:hypothetical protein AK812_SmicGene32565 [Symbiodinium microadriaticum]|uniref:Uncharacterized protein n=1 Tax=Symbiodinium microadriaticum TaxID=2951 RepID=A0A1Q9CTU8_SYMMI|nr:hypothetical protein AK812_SmicGene32565 [Symbiodinium microadriaticum]